jgi:hypothetical protein
MGIVARFALWLLAALVAVGGFTHAPDAFARKGAAFGGKHYSTGASVKADTRDIATWETPVPVTHQGAYSVPDRSQVGSRIYYVNAATGVDSLTKTVASYYYWNGTNIVDTTGSTVNVANGQTYGTDPFNPNEAAILPYATWGYVAPRRTNTTGADGDLIGTASSEIAGTRFVNGAARHAYPDWWLFKAGQTIRLDNDLATYGTTSFGGGLSVPGSTDANNPQVIGAYGSLASGRAKFTHPYGSGGTNTYFVFRTYSSGDHALGNVVYRDLEFNGHDRTGSSTTPGVQIVLQPTSASKVLFENVWLNGTYGFQFQSGYAQVKIKRSIVTDSWVASGRVQGIYTNNYEGHSLQVEDSIFLRNGFTVDPAVTWPPTYSAQDRNFYVSGHCLHESCWVKNTVSMLGGSGDQFRSGFKIIGSFFYQGYVANHSQAAFSLWGGTQYGSDTQLGRSVEFRDNVLQHFYSAGAHTTGGLGFGASSRRGSAHRNIVTAAALGATAMVSGFSLSNVSHYQQQLPTWTVEGHDIADNIFYGTPTTVGNITADGVDAGAQGTISSITVANPAVLTSTAHGRISGESLIFRSTGTLPCGLTNNGEYFVRNPTANTFNLSATAAGALIETTCAGSGTYSYIDPSSYVFSFPGIVRNTVRENIIVGAAEGGCNVSGRLGATCPDTATVYTGNTLYASQAAATSGQGWPAPNRTLKTYLEDIGVTVSSSDGFDEYFVLATQMTRGNWRRDLTAKYLVNYIRYGFGWPAIAANDEAASFMDRVAANDDHFRLLASR